MADFAGLRVFVVGANGALGGGLAAAFVAAGASVVGLDREAPKPERRIAEVDYREVDVLDDAALGAAFDAGPPPWAVINVVGGFAGHRALTSFDPDELNEQLTLNLTSAALVTKHALRRMGEVGTGRLVHTSSRAALVTDGVGFAYSVSKLGVLHLVQMAAAETHGTGITVNAVVPSIMDTPANRSAMPHAAHDQWPKVEEVAAVFLSLAAPSSHLVSGAAVPVYGRS